jgi:hypothetical protein
MKWVVFFSSEDIEINYIFSRKSKEKKQITAPYDSGLDPGPDERSING